MLAVLSLKGGVGKTTTVLGLAGAALQAGVPTLVVDLDPQGNASTALGVDAAPAVTVAQVLANPRSAWRTAVQPSAWLEDVDGDAVVDVLPAGPGLERLEGPAPGPAALRPLRTALSRLTGYDLVLLDCPPHLGQLTRGALVASQRALVVAEPTLFAVQGAQRAFTAVAEERRHNPDLQPLGVLVNRFRERSPEHRFRLAELRELFGPLVLTPPVPERSAVQQAQGAAQPVQLWGTPGGEEVAAAFDRLFARIRRAAGARRRR